MSNEEKKKLQIKASKGDKKAMKALNDARAAGKIGKESGFGPKSDTPPLRPDGSVNTTPKKPTSKDPFAKQNAQAKKIEAELRKKYANKKPDGGLTEAQVRGGGGRLD
jgi:hypothetical protein